MFIISQDTNSIYICIKSVALLGCKATFTHCIKSIKNLYTMINCQKGNEK